MRSGAVERRIFIVGVPRSGTTLVQSLLAAHSRVVSFTESHFFSRHFRLLPPSTEAVLVRNPLPRLRKFLRENRIQDDAREAMEADLSRLLPPAPLLPLKSRTVARQLMRSLDEIAASRQRPIWVEKTPRHLRYVPFLRRLSGSACDTRFVHVIRQGLDTVASLHRASQTWERPYDLTTCVERWNRDTRFSLRRAESSDDRFVFYEELTQRPEEALTRLCAELDLPWEPGMLERHGDSAPDLIAAEETWKADAVGPIRASRASERSLTDDQRRFVTESLRSDLYTRLRDVSS